MLAMMSFLTFKMGIHLPLVRGYWRCCSGSLACAADVNTPLSPVNTLALQAIQAAMLPLELFTSPIAGKYLLGSTAATPYDEKLEPCVSLPLIVPLTAPLLHCSTALLPCCRCLLSLTSTRWCW